MKKFIKSLSVLIALLHVDTSWADIFFAGNSSQFVRTELVRTAHIRNSNLEDSIYFAACQVIQQDRASCTGLVQIEKGQFKSMRRCLRSKIGLNTVGAGVTVVASGMMAATVIGAPAVVTIDAAAIGASSAATVSASYKLDVYDQRIEKQISYVSDEIRYQRFIKSLQTTLKSSWVGCDVSGHWAPVDKTPYLITLTNEQKSFLTVSD
jgi:hypothetical protein